MVVTHISRHSIIWKEKLLVRDSDADNAYI